MEFNLAADELALDVFNSVTNASELLMRLSSLSHKPLVPGKSIIFVDEIQKAKDAITPIKFLVRNSGYKFIFSGSLLGVKMQEISSIPVGFLTIMRMYPMDFEEFSLGVGISEQTLSYLRNCYSESKPVDEIIHKQMMNLFNVYLVVGGMPNAVKTFIDSNDIYKVNRVLNDIDRGYREDIGKYSKDSKLLIQDIYDLIPSELNAQNKRFILKNLNEKARFYQRESSFAWLSSSGLLFSLTMSITPSTLSLRAKRGPSSSCF